MRDRPDLISSEFEALLRSEQEYALPWTEITTQEGELEIMGY